MIIEEERIVKEQEDEEIDEVQPEKKPVSYTHLDVYKRQDDH